MKTNINYLHEAEKINLTGFLNCYIRDIQKGGAYVFRLPEHDPDLRACMQQRKQEKWLRLDLPKVEQEAFCALTYHSRIGRNQYDFPMVIRSKNGGELREIGLVEFAELAVRDIELRESDKPFMSQDLIDSIKNSRDTTALFLQYRNETENDIDEVYAPDSDFIKAEQSLLTGHAMHPVPKSRSGISAQDLIKYSPETKARFQLHYFLAHPDIVREDTTTPEPISTIIYKELLQGNYLGQEQLELLEKHAGWKLIPVHPWEIAYLKREDRDVQALLHKNLMIELGPLGPELTPTSSVRTLFSEEADFMVKLSLHVKITNCERTNLWHEIVRGHEISMLMKSDWGKRFRAAYPDFVIIEDPAYMAVEHEGQNIKGLNVCFRDNIFKNSSSKNITMLGELCQDGLMGRTNRLDKLIRGIAQSENCTTQQASAKWFKRYLELFLDSIISIYNDFGMIFEAHQQNIMLGTNAQGYPDKVYFRDNQGFYFREGKVAEVQQYLPNPETALIESKSFGSEELVNPMFLNYIMISNIAGLISTFGVNGLTDELSLLQLVKEKLKVWEPLDKTGLVDYILHKKNWKVKSNLLTRLGCYCEATDPIAGVTHVAYPNPLLQDYFEPELLQPTTTGKVYERYFAEEGITVTLRPFVLERDLEMVHDWFNREHTKAFWRMDGPIQKLEAFYLNLLDQEFSHAYIGEINGEPSFTFEPYWAIRDVVGNCYDALPSDYGIHFLVATTDPEKKFTKQFLAAAIDFMFSHKKVGKLIGEADINAIAMHRRFVEAGYQFIEVIEQPHKVSSLTYCYREDFYKTFEKENTGAVLSTLN